MNILKKSVLLISISAAFISCNNKSPNDESKKNELKKDITSETIKEIDFEGNYVTDDYSKRNEGFDWTAVTVVKKTDSTYKISIRSRADKKKPSCTLDAIAVSSGDNILKASSDGNNINFAFKDNVLNIYAENKDDIEKLMYYCSGGANIAGTYTKINEPLDNVQIDPTVFQKFLSLQDISFNINSTGKGSIQKLIIQPEGLKSDNKIIELEVDGSVTNAEIEDLNSDGSPELLIYTTSAGSGSYGNVIGYSVNNGKSMSQIYFPPVAENPIAKVGYMGHDEFSIVENNLVQRFPIYNEGDTNNKPTGNIRQITYKLVDGEASRKFVVDKIVEIIPE